MGEKASETTRKIVVQILLFVDLKMLEINNTLFGKQIMFTSEDESSRCFAVLLFESMWILIKHLIRIHAICHYFNDVRIWGQCSADTDTKMH